MKQINGWQGAENQKWMSLERNSTRGLGVEKEKKKGREREAEREGQRVIDYLFFKVT